MYPNDGRVTQVYIAKTVPRQQQCSNFCILLLQTPFVAVATFIAASRTSVCQVCLA